MNKREFLNYLEKRLTVLNQKEREDILSEYAQHIEMKMQSGLSEEEAIKDFGNIEELADEILSAYNVDPNYKKGSINTEKVEKTIHSGIDIIKHGCAKAMETLNSVSDNFQTTNLGETVKFIIKNLLILGILFIILIIGGVIVFGVSDWLYGILPGGGIDYIVSCGLIIVYLAISIIIFMAMVCGLFKNKNIIKKQSEITSVEEETTNKDTNNGNDSINRNNYKYIFKGIKNLLLLCIRIGALFYIVPYILFFVFTVILMGTLFVFMLMGYPVIGIFIASVGFNLSGISLLIFVVKYLYFTKYTKVEVCADEK